ncbi:helix-turn-helix transcriptional regulator [Brucella intermedia]|uniref:AraC family transcriptional regulator n=1 Tax=Brucella intermedia TaxID=94625 RepID=UPI00209B98CC|nr:helix-turn-helix transcriptional regulator [Brucella intermedia]MCO7735963.1 helix-turn-helix transcriptional regulator [Brucella intermedia]WLF98148.1 helix-turn-helix transcriptional regulator [Brucella intermedia]
MSLNYPAPLALAISAIAQDDASFAGPPHRHRDAQLIYARSGVVTVATENGSWVVPPNRAVWVPSMVEHATRSHGPVQFRTIFIHPDAARSLPSACGVVEVSSLLRELILRLVELQDRPATPFAHRVCELLLEELTFLPAEPLSLSMPSDHRLRTLCQTLQVQPDTELSLDAAASQTGMSRRSFMRHFERETGMTYGRWRQQARLLAALPALAAGVPVVTVALDCGYQSASAFAATFKRSLGRSPASYFE